MFTRLKKQDFSKSELAKKEFWLQTIHVAPSVLSFWFPAKESASGVDCLNKSVELRLSKVACKHCWSFVNPVIPKKLSPVHFAHTKTCVCRSKAAADLRDLLEQYWETVDGVTMWWHHHVTQDDATRCTNQWDIGSLHSWRTHSII